MLVDFLQTFVETFKPLLWMVNGAHVMAGFKGDPRPSSITELPRGMK